MWTKKIGLKLWAGALVLAGVALAAGLGRAARR